MERFVARCRLGFIYKHFKRKMSEEKDGDLEESSPKKIKVSETSADEEEELPLPPPVSDPPKEPEESVSASAKSKHQLEEEEREKMLVLVSNFTEDQLDRYEMFRRAAFPKATVKRVMQNITGCSVGQNVIIAMAGIAKVFAGEVIEEALDALEKSQGDNNPGLLKPKHLREAVRKVRLKGNMPKTKATCPFL